MVISTHTKRLRTPSGRLFVERARAASPSFALTTENAPAVASICWRVAGLPLALELAAAKVRLLEPAALLSRLDQALSTAWARDLPERQRTMRATLDWSYELLSEPQRRLFRRLSVFAGGFTLEAAEAIGATHEPEEVLDLLGLLGALVEQSLVVLQPRKVEGEVRYGMLEPVRQYALEKLEESGEAQEARRRHVAFFLDLSEEAEPELRGSRQVEWLERLEGLAVVAGMRGEAEHSARLLGAAGRLLEEAGASVYNYYKPDRSLYERTAAKVRSQLGEAAFEEARERGREMTFEQAAAYALEDDETSTT
jgi:predicted ATPase